MKHPQSWPPNNIARRLAMNLWDRRVPRDRIQNGRERELQLWLFDEIREWAGDKLQVKCEARAGEAKGGVLPVKVFNTSFWPDLALESNEGALLVAVEVKVLGASSTSSRLSSAPGQALMYRQIYAQSLVVLLIDSRAQTPPPPFFENVAEHQIEVTLLRIEDTGA